MRGRHERRRRRTPWIRPPARKKRRGTWWGMKEGRIVEEGVDFVLDSEDGADDDYIIGPDSSDDAGEDSVASVDVAAHKTAMRAAAWHKAAVRESAGHEAAERKAAVLIDVAAREAAVVVGAASREASLHFDEAVRQPAVRINATMGVDAAVAQPALRVDATVGIDAAARDDDAVLYSSAAAFLGDIHEAMHTCDAALACLHEMDALLKRLHIQVKAAMTWDNQVYNAIFCYNFVTWK